MRVLLINPSFTYHTPWMQITEPLGVLYLASYVRRFSQHEIGIVDCLDTDRIIKIGPQTYWYGLSMEDLLQKVVAFAPDVVGITCLFSKKKDDFLACAKAIRTRLPGVVLVAGGTYPSLFAEDVLKTGVFDHCIVGEGEESFLALLNALADGNRSYASIDGLAYVENGAITVNPKQSFIKDLDRLPFPARDLIRYETYVERKSVIHGLGLRRAASILTSRSCPNRCNFCSMFRVHGPRWRGRTAQNVVDEIIELREKFGIRDLFIMDDNFTLNTERVRVICEMLVEARLDIQWNTPNGISINTLNKDILRTMKRSGCTSICIAVESGDEELRNTVIGKRLSDKKIEEVTKAAADLGIFVTAFYIIGMPGETNAKFEKTLDHLRTFPYNAVAAAFANPLPGTKLYDDCIAHKWHIRSEGAEQENILYKPFIITEDFTERDLLDREKRFYRTFFFARFFTIVKDTLLFRNMLLYPPYLMRIVKDRLFRKK